MRAAKPGRPCPCTDRRAPLSQDDINTGTWSRANAIEWLASVDTFTDAGERAAYAVLLGEQQRYPVLELGVGPGRALPFLRAIATDYVGIDYVPAMIEAAKRRFPDADLRVGDARDLSAFADGHFGLVAFAFMGLDAVDRAGRARVLAEAHRVLRPGGRLWFSTFNLTGPHSRERPWNTLRYGDDDGLGTRLWTTLSWLRRLPLRLSNYRAARARAVAGDEWMVAPLSAHDFGLLIHYTTLDEQVRQLRLAGFTGDIQAFDNRTGEPVAPGADTSGAEAFNLLCCK